MENLEAALGIGYWLRWQVVVCALILILPATIALRLLRSRHKDPIDPSHFWVPSWRGLHPRWLLFYRAFAFASMAFLLYQTVATFGFFVFFFYTQWTFALVMVYFALGTLVSARGCLWSLRSPFAQCGETDRFMKKDPDETNSHDKEQACVEQHLGLSENLMHIVYQTCAGAVMLTDIVFWCLLLPFMTGENFQLTLLIGCMHSVNAIFLFLDSALNKLPFSWYGLVYFILWSCVYVAFQWILHACCYTWWPYPFLDLSTPWAPLWYFALALVHIPCYGIYVLLIKLKDGILSRMFAEAYVRVTMEKKGT
nr:uncharacterized protein LOC109182898 isoform X1 [Ipomoea batatas]